VTLIGVPGGSIEKGWDHVRQRLDWVASLYSAGTRRHEEVSRVVTSNLASVVQREVIRFRIFQPQEPSRFRNCGRRWHFGWSREGGGAADHE
jgi:hypothetical protein